MFASDITPPIYISIAFTSRNVFLEPFILLTAILPKSAVRQYCIIVRQNKGKMCYYLIESRRTFVNTVTINELFSCYLIILYLLYVLINV